MATSAPPGGAKYGSKLHGKRVLIFGGSSGIGYGVAEASTEAGATVIIASSSQSKIDEKVKLLGATYPAASARVSGHACDLADAKTLEQNIEAVLKFATEDGAKKLDHVAFTAGDRVAIQGVADATVESILAGGTVRFMAPIVLAKLLVPRYMHASAESSLTVTSGVRSSKPAAGWAILAGWGAGIEGLARGLAVDLKPIRVNCVAPGAVRTELFGPPNDRLEGMLKKYREQSLTGTIGRPEDLAESYLYCMRSHFVTGTVMHSDGGSLLA